MIRLFLDLIALGASCVALYFIVRLKATYFLDSRFFMALANAIFILMLVQGLAGDALQTPPIELLTVFMTFTTAVCVGFASFLLMTNSRRTHDHLGVLGNLIAWPPKQFLVFTAVAASWLTSGVILQPWSRNMVSTFDGPVYFYSFDNWFLIVSGVFLAAFIAGPVATAYRRASGILDPKASNSVRTISVAWALFGVVALFQEVVTGTLATFEQSGAIITNSILFLAISFAIREPTVLSRIISEDYQKQSSGSRNSDVADNLEQRQLGIEDAENQFAALLRLKHDDLKDRRLLVEYDPTTNYESLVKKFAAEFCTNAQPVAVFTSVGSPAHKVVQGTKDIKLFSFSAKTSTPSRLSDAEILLPERDASLLLDAIDKLFQTHQGKIGLAFDVFTDLILFKSFEKAYAVLSSVAEMADSHSATTLVLINETALDVHALSGVRSLFISQLSYGAGGLQVIRTRTRGPLKTGMIPDQPVEEGGLDTGGLKG